MVFLQYKNFFKMKTRLLLITLPCILLGACNSNPEKDAATKKNEESAAAAHRDSLLNAAKAFHNQNAADTTKGKDSANKANPKKGNVD